MKTLGNILWHFPFLGFLSALYTFILGLIFTNKKRQRVCNKIGNTLIIKIKNTKDYENLKYIKD